MSFGNPGWYANAVTLFELRVLRKSTLNLISSLQSSASSVLKYSTLNKETLTVLFASTQQLSQEQTVRSSPTRILKILYILMI
jgi:hypothetical protein